MKAISVAVVIVLGLAVAFLLVPWMAWLALGVVLPAFGIAAPPFFVVWCGWFLLGIVGSAFRSGSK